MRVLGWLLRFCLAAPISASAVAPCPLSVEAMVGVYLSYAPLSSFDGVQAPGGDGNYVTPSGAEFATLSEATRLLATGQIVQAADGFMQVGFQVCEASFADATSPAVFVVHDADANSRNTSRGAAIAVLRNEAIVAGRWAVLAPHAVTETNVATMALELLQDPALPVSAVVVGAVDRCNRLELAPAIYQAQTEHCGGSFRTSDMAHTDDSFFHAFHVGLQQASDGVGTLQLHGMGTPGASISRGTVADWADFPQDLVASWHVSLREKLVGIGVAGGEVTACSAHDGPGGIPFRNLLCGTRSAATALAGANGNASINIHLELGSQARATRNHRSAVAKAWRRALDQLHRNGFEAAPTQ